LLASRDKQKEAPRQSNQGTRQNVAYLRADDPVLVSYRKAVAAMKKLPPDNPLSWQFQANMHGVPTVGANNDAWRWCMHGNWWFLPWHRGYLYHFEKIVRKMSGDDGFRLPYWAWEKEGQNVLPAPFRNPKYGGKENPLFDRSRKVANQGVPLRPRQIGSFSVDWERTRAVPQFTSAYPELAYGGVRVPKTAMLARPDSTHQHGQMEQNAHDLLHDAVAGNMGDPDTAARDPIFWLHHSNVDRLWNRWLDLNNHLLPDPAADKDWYDQEFPFFNEEGKQVVLSVSRILELASSESRYDDDVKVFAAAPRGAQEKEMKLKLVGVASTQPKLTLGTKPLIRALTLTEDAKPRLMSALAVPPADSPPPILLRVEGIKPGKDVRLTYEVFLMKKGEKPSSSFYVGTISFFGRRTEHEVGEGFTQGFDVTRVVQRLKSANKGKLPEFEVAIIPHSTAGLTAQELAKQKVTIPISNISLTIATVEKE
jgi:tyrosinase